MASLTNEQKAKLIDETRTTAIALVEDLKYLREVISRIETSRGELRRLSAVLRRILVEEDLLKVAAPRLGRITLLAPDNNPFYKAANKVFFLFFASGGANVFGVGIEFLVMMNAGPAGPDPERKARETARLLNDVTHARIDLRPDKFLSQRVLCYRGQWVSRREVIKHIANVASGVHSQTAMEAGEKFLEAVRAACSYSIQDQEAQVHLLPELGIDSAPIKFGLDPGTPPLNFSVAALDPLLVEVLATANFLIKSPDIARLEAVIQEEAYKD
ncbi:MAG: hypothetical protein ACREC1_09910 [Methylovirgula sp.]